MLVGLVACRGEPAGPTSSPPSATSAPSATEVVDAAAPPVATSVASAAVIQPADAAAENPCTGALLGEAVFQLCPSRLVPLPPTTGVVFTSSLAAVTLKPGEGADVTLTVANTSNVAAPVLLKIEPEAALTGPLHVVPAQIDKECAPSSAPSHVRYALVQLQPGGKLQWTRRVQATRHVHVVDVARSTTFTGSGTLCLTREDAVPKGTYDVRVANPIGPASTVHVTVP